MSKKELVTSKRSFASIKEWYLKWVRSSEWSAMGNKWNLCTTTKQIPQTIDY